MPSAAALASSDASSSGSAVASTSTSSALSSGEGAGMPKPTSSTAGGAARSNRNGSGGGGGAPIRRPRSKSVSQHLDPSTLPFARAYAVGFTASILPSLLRILVPLLTTKKPRSIARVARQIWDALVRATSYNGLALAFGITVGGAKWGESKVEGIVASAYVAALRRIRTAKARRDGMVNDDKLQHVSTKEILQDPKHDRQIKILSTLLSATIASFVSISLLQSRPSSSKDAASVAAPAAVAAAGAQLPDLGFSPYSALNGPVAALKPALPAVPLPPIAPARAKESPTLDMTLFLFVRAADTLVRAAYEKTGLTTRSDRFGRVSQLVAKNADTLLFWASCWRIMWCFFYLPHRLPKAYNQWILRLARMDVRLLRLLQYARKGEYVYGNVPSQEVITMCEGIAAASGIPASRVIPSNIKRLDCAIVHGQVGKGTCEVNAIKRWLWAFVDCFAIYLPVHLIPPLLFNARSIASHPLASVIRILLAAGRSSAFLATFVASIYGSVCLVRTRLPMALPLPQQWLDGGLCTGLGCFLCGFSVLIENKRRRREMALYCAPRALYTVLDSIVPSALQQGPMGAWLSRWVERSLFALSTGTVVSATVHRPDLVSGVVSGILGLAVGDWDGKAVQLPRKSSSSA